jgi:hypothetical protein
MLKKFLMKKMMKAQMKGVPEDQQEKILKAVDENPELFEKIALEIQEKVKSGVDQKTAAIEVMTANQDALRRAMGK